MIMPRTTTLNEFTFRNEIEYVNWLSLYDHISHKTAEHWNEATMLRTVRALSKTHHM